MDENPYKAPVERGPKPPAKKSDFSDPVKNLAMLIVVVAILALGFLGAILAEKARARAERENARIGAP